MFHSAFSISSSEHTTITWFSTIILGISAVLFLTANSATANTSCCSSWMIFLGWLLRSDESIYPFFPTLVAVSLMGPSSVAWAHFSPASLDISCQVTANVYLFNGFIISNYIPFDFSVLLTLVCYIISPFVCLTSPGDLYMTSSICGWLFILRKRWGLWGTDFGLTSDEPHRPDTVWWPDVSPGHHGFLCHSEPCLERTVRARVDVGGVFEHISGGSIILTQPTVTAVRPSTTLYIPFVLIEKRSVLQCPHFAFLDSRLQ